MDENQERSTSFFERPGVHLEHIPIGDGVPVGIETVTNSLVGTGGAYGTWGASYDNRTLPRLIESRLGEPLDDQEIMNLGELGFDNRHHLQELSPEEHLELEVEVGSRFLQAAAHANGWKTSEVSAVLIGLSGPVSDDYTERIARKAGVPEDSLKVSIHKACDSSVGGLHMILNPDLPYNQSAQGLNMAEELRGKKVLVGGIEGLSRFISRSRDKNALQLFGNGAGVIGVVPGESMKFLVGRTHEAFDEEGVLAVRMYYPHSGERAPGKSMVEVSRAGQNHIRLAGLMHEPEGEWPVVMAGLMGMVKLFVRTGVKVLQDVYQDYQVRMAELDIPDPRLALAVVHHANLKINKLIEKHLQKEGIRVPMPWVLSEFGNVSAASNMIAFLRKLSELKPHDHILFDGFGAGTYYDVLAVEMGG
jgi:3-oxoacyl-[acyl-carrier-protein] synthase III